MTNSIEAKWEGFIFPEEGETLTEASLETIFEVISDELVTLGYDNVTVSASLVERTFALVAPLDSSDQYPALDTSIRAAFHTAGVITASWPQDRARLEHSPSARMTVILEDQFV